MINSAYTIQQAMEARLNVANKRERQQRRRQQFIDGLIVFALMAIVIAIMALCPSPARSQEILQFGAKWCGPCHEMQPAVDQAKQRGANIRHVDVDAESGLAGRFNIHSIPAFVALDASGRQVGATIAGCRPASDILRLWASVAKAQPQPQQSANVPNAAHCRIEVGTTDLSCGSGTLISTNDRTAIVLTCSHLFDDATRPIACNFPCGRFGANLIAIDKANDLAAVEIRRPKVAPVAVDDTEPSSDDVATVSGYGPDSHFRQVTGRLIGWTLPQGSSCKTAVLSVGSRPGDSGGGILNQRGVLIGVNWGCYEGQAYITCGKPLHAFLQRVLVRKTECQACVGVNAGVSASLCCDRGGCGCNSNGYQQERGGLPADWRHWADGVTACIKQLQDDRTANQQNSPAVDTTAWRDKIDQQVSKMQSDIDARLKDVSVMAGGGNPEGVSQPQLKSACDEMERRMNILRQQNVELKATLAANNAVTSQPRPFYLRVSRDSQYQSVSPGQYVTLPLDKQ